VIRRWGAIRSTSQGGRLGRIVSRFLIGLLVAGCTVGADRSPVESPPGTGQDAPRAPKRIVTAIMGEPSVTVSEIALNNPPGTTSVEQLVSAGLTGIDGQGNLLAQLAREVPSIENGLWRLHPDGRMETEWRLRPDAAWHDGTPVTADDVLFTGRAIQDKELRIPSDLMYEAIDSIEAIEGGVLARWKKPHIEADRLFSLWLMPRHILERPYLDDKATFTEVRYWTHEFIGAGPFRIRDWATGSHIMLDAYDRYVLGRPKIDQIEVRFIPDSNTLLANILANQVELTMGRGLSVEQALHARPRWPQGRMELTITNWIAIFPQYVDPHPAAVADARFRRALLHAIDRQEIVESLLEGVVPIAHNVVDPDQPEFAAIQASVFKYEYDPRRAVRMLDELGFARDAEGMLLDSTGQRQSVEIRQAGGDSTREKVVLSTGAYWQRVGIASEPHFVPRQRQQEREYRATFPAFELVQQPNDIRGLRNLHSSQAPLATNNFVGQNRPRYQNPQYDALLERYLTTIPRNERTQVLAQISRHLTEELVVIGLYYGSETTMIGNRLRNVSAAKARTSTGAWNAHVWDVDG
jgi:peptide/nickel transport system substrate-binding protein